MMDSSLLGDWLYDRVMLQPLGAAGTVETQKDMQMKAEM